ncbi:DNA replication complex GINS protein PSF1 [Drosophila grimshawi]|uniref:DNA replication complex GINS protein PSF1 n=1 Tax=Drosophila grimshawi TaxID=7222 RepID=B4IYK4_DROGR|nr:DNA replication complex GINS protein PSF1 [Drosophila grimshawi]EDV95514.1 GH15736 [Drosophila grimshawi]
MSRSNKMFGDKAFDLLKDLKRSAQTIPAFDDDGVRQVLEEVKAIFEENVAQASSYSSSGDRSLWPLLNYRHAALQRNKRCLLAYLYERMQRIKAMRWEFGPIIPSDIKQALCEPEVQFFNNYSKSLAAYMRSIGDGKGIDLTGNLRPPKSLYIEVRCLENYGKFELDDGEIIHLKKNSQHYLPRAQVEPLVRQGVLQHIA